MDALINIFRLNNIIKINFRVMMPILFLCAIGLIALKSTSIDTLGEHSVFYKQFVGCFAVCLYLYFFNLLEIRLFMNMHISCILFFFY